MNKIILTILCVLLQSASALFAQTNFEKIQISDDIYLLKLSEKAYAHISVADLENFGKVLCNGLLVVDNGEAFLFDTPSNNEQTEILTKFVADSLHAKIIGVIPTHWHSDCLGGLEYLHLAGVKSYANKMTIDFAQKFGKPIPEISFTDFLKLNLHGTDIFCYYLGGGHTADNIVVWLPAEKILFGSCLVKDVKSTNLGNLEDAVPEQWAITIKKVIKKFPQAKIVITGHGQIGDKKALKHTLNLLKQWRNQNSNNQ